MIFTDGPDTETTQWQTDWLKLRDDAHRLGVAVQLPPSLEKRLRDYSARRPHLEATSTTCKALIHIELTDPSVAFARRCGYTYRTGEGHYDKCPKCHPSASLEDLLRDSMAFPGLGWWWCYWRGARGMWVHADDAWAVERRDVEALCEALGEKAFAIDGAIFPAAVREVKRLQAATLRPCVLAFACAMERKLRKHDDDRGPHGWAGDDPTRLLDRVEGELKELGETLEAHLATRHRHAGDIGRGSLRTVTEREVLGEAADVANMAMMVADAVGALATEDAAQEAP